MDYDRIFEKDVNKKFFFSDYQGKKMMDGKISLNYAIERLAMQEYYVLVTYKEGETLPEQYVPLNNLTSDEGLLFATINPKISLSQISQNGGIQMITRLPDLENGSPYYLLGPGPEKVSLEELIMKQYAKHFGNEENNKNHSK